MVFQISKEAQQLLKISPLQFPLIDKDTFINQINISREFFMTVCVSVELEESTSFCDELETRIKNGAFTFNGDNDFATFTAQDKFDFYIKILRRHVSTEVYAINIDDCIQTYTSIEYDRVLAEHETLSSKWPTESKEYQTLEDAAYVNLQIIDNFESDLCELARAINGYIDKLQSETDKYVHFSRALTFPLSVEMTQCKPFRYFRIVR